MSKVWKVAIYARVSTDKKEQSESIPAQVDSLRKWMVDRSGEDLESVYELVEIYEDEGFSGSNFERDSFIRMKDDIEGGKVNMVLTRDLSRFARNYITAGYYLEDYFKEKGIRFVSVLDNVDTIDEVDDIVPFKNILNEMYIKDCSRRTRDGLKQRMLRGSSIASKPPYGYEFQGEYHNNVRTIKLRIREDETSDTVREIFTLYRNGWGMGRIANHLNKKGIQPPSAYTRCKGDEGTMWNGNTIKYILSNPKYCGRMVQGRWKKISYKIKKVERTDESQWIEGEEFQGIITKDEFNQVQDLMRERKSKFRYKKDKVHIFTGVLKCGECGGSMCYRGKYEGYKCLNSQRGGGRCTAHSIKEQELIERVRSELLKHMEKFYVGYFLDRIESSKFSKRDEKTGLMKRITQKESEIEKYKERYNLLYIDKLDGIITGDEFQAFRERFKEREGKLKKDIERLKLRLKDWNVSNESEGISIEDRINEILQLNHIDRNLVERLIESIEVNELDDHKRVNIKFRFKGE